MASTLFIYTILMNPNAENNFFWFKESTAWLGFFFFVC